MTALVLPGRIVRPAPGVEGVSDRWVRRRVGTVWGLIFFNALTPAKLDTLIPYPPRATQIISASSLGLAFLLAVSLNRRLQIRPNLVLGLSTLLLFLAIAADAQGKVGLGALFRTGRLAVFLAVLWLVTPWWGRDDLLVARCHLRAMMVVCATAVVGFVLSPSRSRSYTGGRLAGIIWPTPPTQIAEYAALVVGMTLVLWFAGLTRVRVVLPVCAVAMGVLLLTQTRTALLGLVAGLALAALSLFLSRRRVRRVLVVMMVALPLMVVVAAPTAANFLQRGQSAAEVADLTGRTAIWNGVLAAPRSGSDLWLGFGLSDKSFAGAGIDSAWLAAYQDQGLIGDAVIGLMLLYVLGMPAFRPPGPGRALAILIAAYCAIASYTEVGLGDASMYLLHICVAASLLVQTPSPSLRSSPPR